MISIAEAFDEKKAFIPFITAGDPDLDTTKKLILAIQDAGADLIEIGIPFSDPVAEGPVIQEADMRALSTGITTDDVFDMVRGLKESMRIPMVFMTYINPVYVYGLDKFADRMSECGVDGIIIPDVPYEEKHEISEIFEKKGRTVISMIAPTSADRVKMIAREAKGFVYCVSSMGVTGERANISKDIGKLIKLIKEEKDIPCAIGFGISTPEQAKDMAEISDGAIVGSAIVRMIANHGKDSISVVSDYVRSMKEAIMQA